MPEIELTHLPSGQLAWPVFVDAVSQLDDRAERYFLELKSDVDLNTKVGQAKVAKFILGAANRLPERAAPRFDGHALMVLGVSNGRIDGIPAFEAKDLDREVRKFIGANGPQWDFEKISTLTASRDVIVIKVLPPKAGEVWLCRRDGNEKLRDGAIYVRGDGETREATGDEAHELLERVRHRRPEAAVEVTVTGSVRPVVWDHDVLQEFLQVQTEVLLEARREAMAPKPPPGAYAALNVMYSRPSSFSLINTIVNAEDRTSQQYTEEIEAWAADMEAAEEPLVDYLMGVALPGVSVNVENQAELFMTDVELEVHLEGPVRAIDFVHEPLEESNSVQIPLEARFPGAPRRWGPRQDRALDMVRRVQTSFPYRSPQPAVSRSGTVHFRNGGSVDLSLTLDALRPGKVFTSDNDEIVLVSSDTTPSSVSGTWKLTARDHHAIYQGRLSVPVGDAIDCTEELKAALGRVTA